MRARRGKGRLKRGFREVGTGLMKRVIEGKRSSENQKSVFRRPFSIIGTYRPDGKPGSVSDSHSSRHTITDALQQPTRTLGEQRQSVLFGLAPDGV